jgi:NAD(P)-dependent dehydrogenase (short-subunit alcohol dehydrogenase family)
VIYKMKEEEYLQSLEDLTGKVAVVVGYDSPSRSLWLVSHAYLYTNKLMIFRGTQGIGLSTVVYLALRGAKVYALSLQRDAAGVEVAIKRVENRSTGTPKPGAIIFHELDLMSVRETQLSANLLQDRLRSDEAGRLDILVNNAGIATTISKPSPDGFERTFAVNCLGHFVFINTILGE